MTETIYMINLKKAYEKPRGKRGKRAMKIIRDFISKHMKIETAKVKLSNNLNSVVWERGIQKPPRRVKVKAVKSPAGAYVYHIDEKIEPPKEVKEKVKEEKKEEPKTEKPAPEKKSEKTIKTDNKKPTFPKKREDKE